MNGALATGIDFGTQGARICVVDPQERPVFEHRATWKDKERTSPIAWETMLYRLLRSIPTPLRRRIARLAIDGTSGTVLMVDGRLRPASPALLYNDSSAAGFGNLRRDGIPEEHIALSSTSSLRKFLLLREQYGNPDLLFMHQSDWLASLLHGKTGITDYHNALKLGVDPETGRYPAWLDELDENRQLPRAVAPGSAIGTITPSAARRLSLPPTCEIRAGTTDSNAAFIACGAIQAGDAVTSLGSTLVIKVLSATRVDAPAYGIYSHWFGSHWLTGGASNSGGAVLAAHFSTNDLTRYSALIDPTRLLGLDFYPLLQPGERFPIHDPQLAPRMSPRPDSPVEFLQALLEGIADIEARGYQLLSQLGATPVRRVLTAGGGAVNQAWTTIRQTKLGIPVEPALHTEAAFGTAVLALRGESLFALPAL